MQLTGLDFHGALASLVIGRTTAAVLRQQESNPHSSQQMAAFGSRSPPFGAPLASPLRLSAPGLPSSGAKGALARALSSSGLLDVRAWLAQTPADIAEDDTVKPVRAIAAAAVLQSNTESVGVRAVQLADMDLEEAPDTLHLLSSLMALSLSGNSLLRSVAALRRCGEIRALDLSGCSQLQDVRALGVLPYLEVLDLSQCSRLLDIRQLLIPSKEGWAPRSSGGIQPEESESPQLRGKLGHPTLSWLSLAGCTELRGGLSDIPRCPALAYVDLYGCLQVDPFDCHSASQAPKLQGGLVWPSLSVLEHAAAEQALSAPLKSTLAASATKAIAEKLRLARGQRPTPKDGAALPALSGNAHREALRSALCAAAEMGMLPDKDARADPEALLESMLRASEASRAAQEDAAAPESRACRQPSKAQEPPSPPPQRLSPVDFALAARAAGFEARGRIDACDVFRVLDMDCDGGLTLQELQALETGSATQAQADAAVQVLLQRRGGNLEALAADLAGDRSSVERHRLRECLIVAGIDELTAQRVTGTIVHCCQAAPTGAGDVEGSLRHALGAFVVARSAELLVDFSVHLHGRFPRCEDAYWVLNENRSGSVSMEEFRTRVKNPLRWQGVMPGTTEVLFRALDIDSTGNIGVLAFSLLEDFNAKAAIEAMLQAGRIISRGTVGGCPAALCPPEAMAGDNRGFTRAEFQVAWKELAPEACRAVDARIIFGLLDINGNNFIQHEELALLTDALPRRAVSAAAGDLELLLKKRFGSLEAAHAALLQPDAHVILRPQERPSAPKNMTRQLTQQLTRQATGLTRQATGLRPASSTSDVK